MTDTQDTPITIAQARLRLVDPHDCTDANDDLTVLGAICDTLVKRRGGRFVPHLAQSWDVSEGGCLWRFRLAEARFADGSPVDAASVIASFRRMAREDKGYTLGAPAVWKQYLGGAEMAGAGRDLELRLAAPMADLLDVLVQGFILNPACLPALDAGQLHEMQGSGPYMLTEFTGEVLHLAANPSHFAGPPANPALVIRREPDPAARLALLASGAVQLANTLDPAAPAPAGCTLHRHRAPVAIIYLLNSAAGPLADPRVRLALSLAIDRPSLVQTVLAGQGEPLHGFVSPAHFGAGTERVPHDPARAAALLDAAGHGNGLTLRLDCPTRLPDEAQRLTAALAEQLAPLGIRFDITVHEDREAYAHAVRRKEIGDLCVFDSSPMSTYRVLYEKIDSRTAGAWWQGYRNPEVEALIDRGRAEPDAEARAALWRQAYALLQQDPPWLTLYNPLRAVGLRGGHPGFAMPEDGVIDLAALPSLSPVTA